MVDVVVYSLAAAIMVAMVPVALAVIFLIAIPLWAFVGVVLLWERLTCSKP